MQFNQIEDVEKPSNKKRVRIYEQDEATIVLHKISNNINTPTNDDNNSIETDSINSAQNSVKFLVPK